VLPTAGPLVFASVLDHLVGAGHWQVELRTVAGLDELIVYVGHDARHNAAPLLESLVREMPPVTQFVLVPPARVAQRLAEYDGEAVLDGRVALTM
jgi:hypothetical protein